MKKYKLDELSNKLFVMNIVAKNTNTCLKSKDLKSILNLSKRTIPGEGLLRRSSTAILLRFDIGSPPTVSLGDRTNAWFISATGESQTIGEIGLPSPNPPLWATKPTFEFSWKYKM